MASIFCAHFKITRRVRGVRGIRRVSGVRAVRRIIRVRMKKTDKKMNQMDLRKMNENSRGENILIKRANDLIVPERTHFDHNK